MDIPGIIAGYCEGNEVAVLKSVTAALDEWTRSPQGATPLLLSLRDTMSLLKKSLSTTMDPKARQEALEETSSEQVPKTRKPKSKASGNQVTGNFVKLYEAGVAFVKSFGLAAKCGLFDDASTMNLAVSDLLQMVQVEATSPCPPKGKSKGSTSALLEASISVFEILLGLPKPTAEVEISDAVPETNQPIDYHDILLPLLLPCLWLSYTTSGTTAGQQLRNGMLQFLKAHFLLNKENEPKLLQLLQYMCLHSRAGKFRSDTRKWAVNAIAELSMALTSEDAQKTFQLFVRGSSVSPMDKVRQFAVEVTGTSLLLLFDEESNLKVQVDRICTMMEVLLLRCNDTYVAARRSALTSWADVVDVITSTDGAKEIFETFLKAPASYLESLQSLSTMTTNLGEVPMRTNRDVFVAIVMCRLKEDRPLIRKASLQVLETILSSTGVPLDMTNVYQHLIDMTQSHVEDSVLVRKQALGCLSVIASQHINDCVSSASVDKATMKSRMELACRILNSAILPSFTCDDQDSMKKMALSIITELIFEPLTNSKDKRLPCVWELIGQLTGDSRPMLASACSTLAPTLAPSIAKTLQHHIRAAAEGEDAALALLANLSPGMKIKLETEWILECYERKKEALNDGTLAGASTFGKVLVLLATLQLPEAVKQTILEEIETALTQVKPYHSLFSPMLELLFAIHDSKKGFTEQVQQLLESAKDRLEEYCKKRTLGGTEGPATDIGAAKFALLVGDLVLICTQKGSSCKVPKQIQTFLQALIQAPLLEDMDLNDDPADGLDVPMTPMDGRGPSDCFTPLATPFGRRAGSNLTNASQLEMTVSKYTRATLDGTQEAVPAPVQGAALLTFGKLCLIQESLAKSMIPVLVNHLRKAGNEIVKSNILAVLADLGAEYSGSVDKYIPIMAAFIRDRSVLVRHTALVLITQLLAEGFIKWKSTLVFSFVPALIDENRIVAAFAESALIKVLLPKQPNLFFNNFLECLFVLNNYQGHPAYNQNPLQDMSYLAGEMNGRKRLTLYRFLLKHMSQEHLYRLHMKLHTELLALFCSTTGSELTGLRGGHVIDVLTPPGAHIMTDTFAILLSKDMKLSAKAPKAMTEDEDQAEALNELNRKVYADMFQKHIEGTVIPVLLDLRRHLKANKSPYMKQLDEYMHMVLQEYKHEIQNLLAADPQLLMEFEYDCRQQQKQKPARPAQLSMPQESRRLSGRRISMAESMTSSMESPGSINSLTPLSKTSTPQVRRTSLSTITNILPSPTSDPSRALFSMVDTKVAGKRQREMEPESPREALRQSKRGGTA